MNRTHLLATSTIVALAAGVGVSMAQQERNAPAEKIAPPSARQPPAMHHQNGDAQNAPVERNERSNGRVSETPQNRGRAGTTGQAPPPIERNSERDRAAADQRLKSHQEERNGETGQAPREDQLNRRSGENRVNSPAPRERERTNQADENRATTGQGSAGTRGNIDLTPEKRTRIHDVIVRERKAPRLSSVDFDVSVGARVPRSTRFLALPPTIVEIEPEWRGFEYFMIADQIVIVDPRSMEIVAIVDV
jgi:Protein of unknown function (DUF1236)